MTDSNTTLRSPVIMTNIPRGLTSVPEAEEAAVSPISRKGSPALPLASSPSNPFGPGMFNRITYSRVPSDGAQEMVNVPRETSNSAAANEVDGLGISMAPTTPTIRRVPVGSSRQSPKQSPPETPRSHHGLLETPANSTTTSPTGYFSNIASPSSKQPAQREPQPYMDRITRQDHSDDEGETLKHHAAPMSRARIPSTPHPAAGQHETSPPSLSPEADFLDEDFDDDVFKGKFGQIPNYCWSRREIHMKKNSWTSVTIFVLSVYATVMSGIWLVVSILQPRWGHAISSRGGLLPSTATLLAALTAKTIEMAFVTVFVACIGQVLTRRALVRKSRGMTLAEMTLRDFVVQPGALAVRFETLPYTIVTVIGALSLTATVATMFYTTASDAMVAPKLMSGDWESKQLSGYVRSSYANSAYIKEECPSLLTEIDALHAAESCMNVEFSGDSYRNLQAFMTTWTSVNENGTSLIDDIAQRPPGTSLLHGNTTMTGSWIETQHSNVTAHFQKTGRIINNVTLAMPHPGVYAAATSSVNGILQPDDLAGVGEYTIRAGVVSPAINAMCVAMTAKDLAPLVYTEWPRSRKEKTGVGEQEVGKDGWDGDVPPPLDDKLNGNYLNATDVDDVFRWGKKYNRRPPVFQLYPSDYNLLVNSTVYMSDAIYILGKNPASVNYTLCEMRSWVSPNCSTQFNISGTVGSAMRAHCEDPNDKDSYLRSFPPTGQTWAVPSKDWRWIADQWRYSMDLNAGARNDNASNARILSQLSLTTPELPSYLPSLAEALAVYASSTIILGAVDTPFHHWWEYEKPGNILGAPGTVQAFNATLSTQEYTSGHINSWQGIFYAPLVFVFALSLFCLSYFIMRSGLVTDFTEPQNLFALALNSPPSAQLKGSCGGGPEKRDLVVPWRVAYAPSANHYFFAEANEKPWKGRYANEEASLGVDYGEPKGSSYKRLSRNRGWL